jgi:hypothetical protein
MGMKFKIAVTLILAALVVSGFAAAQSQSGPENGPLALVKIAINVVSNTKHQNVDGHLAIYIPPEKWAAGLKDGDLGQFLKLKEQKPGRGAVFIFSASKDTAVAVYFDGGVPFGMTAVKAGSNGKIDPGDISAAYKAITNEMLKATGKEFSFEAVPINTDDGDSLAAYLIAKK